MQEKSGWGFVIGFILYTIMWWCLTIYGFYAMQTPGIELWMMILVGIISLYFCYHAIKYTLALILTLILSVYLAFKLCKKFPNTQYYITETDKISDLIELKNVKIIDDNEEYEEIEDEII